MNHKIHLRSGWRHGHEKATLPYKLTLRNISIGRGRCRPVHSNQNHPLTSVVCELGAVVFFGVDFWKIVFGFVFISGLGYLIL